MNWQLTEQIEEFRDEQEQLLTQLPLGGSQFMKMWWDDIKKRPCAEFVPIDNILLPFAAASFYTSPRVTEQQDISQWEFQNRIDRGLYRDVSFIRATLDPEPTASEKANEKIEGKKMQSSDDGAMPQANAACAAVRVGISSSTMWTTGGIVSKRAGS